MALGSGNWVIMGELGGTSGTPLIFENTTIQNKEKVLSLHLKMGASGYPAAGIPMPGYASVGFYRNVRYLMSPVMSTGLLTGKTVMFSLSAATTGTVTMRAYRMVSGAASDQQALACTGVLAAAQHFYLTARGW